MNTQAPKIDVKAEENTPMASIGDVSAKLRDLLVEGIDIHRCAAAQALGTIDISGNTDVLMQALLDEDEDVRTDAATALGLIGDKATEEALLNNLLGDPSNDVKGAAIDSLIDMRAENVIPWLRKLVLAKDEDILWDDGDYYEGGWDDWVDIQLKALRGLGQVKDAEAIPLILKAMDDEYAQDMEEQAFAVFVKMGEEGMKVLDLALDSPKELTRHRSAMVLCRSDDAAAAPFVAKCLKDASAAIRLSSAEALFEKNPRDPRLAEILWDADKDVRLAMLKKLGHVHVDWTVAQLDEQDSDVLRVALGVIAAHPDAFKDKNLTPKIHDMMEDADQSLEIPLLGSIAGLEGSNVMELLCEKLADTKAQTDVRLAVIAAMEKIGGESVDGLIDVLGDNERQVRLAAMSVLVRLAKIDHSWPNAAGEALLAASRGELVTEPTPEEIEAAKQATENGEDDSDGEEDLQVIETMQPLPPFDPNAEPVEDARMAEMAEAERDVAKAESFNEPVIEEQLEDPTKRPNIATKVDEALLDADKELPSSTLGMILADEKEAQTLTVKSHEMVPLDEAEQALLDMSKNNKLKKRKVRSDIIVAPHIDVKFFAAKLLGDLAQSEVALALSNLIRSGDKDLRMAALDSLSVAGRELDEFEFDVVQPLLMTLNDPDRDIRMLSIRALASAPGKGTVNLLADKSDDDDNFVRIEAARALGKLANDAGPLQAFLDDDDVNVRLAAADALSHVGGADAVKLLVEFVRMDGGKYARVTGTMLRDLDVNEANGRLLEILADEAQIKLWLPAINALDVLNAKDNANTAMV